MYLCLSLSFDRYLQGERDGKSVLDKNPEAKAILELMNKGNASDGYRDKKKAFEEDGED